MRLLSWHKLLMWMFFWFSHGIWHWQSISEWMNLDSIIILHWDSLFLLLISTIMPPQSLFIIFFLCYTIVQVQRRFHLKSLIWSTYCKTLLESLSWVLTRFFFICVIFTIAITLNQMHCLDLIYSPHQSSVTVESNVALLYAKMHVRKCSTATMNM